MFYIPFLIVLFYGIGVRKSEQGNKYFCIITGLLYFTLAAFRGASVGTDTPQYVNNFLSIAGWPLERVAMLYRNDTVFYLLVSMLGRFTENYTILFAIVAGWSIYSMWRFVHKYSSDVALSIIILLALNLYQFTLTGMRQTIAMGFVIWAFDFLLQKKNLRAAICILVGGLFHQSAMITLILIPTNMLIKKVTRNGALITCGVLALVYVMRSNIARNLIVLIEDRNYSITDGNNGLMMTFVIFALLIMMSVFMDAFSARVKHASTFFIIGAFACAFQMLVATQPIFFRLAFYFLMIYPLMIPLFVGSLRKGDNHWIMKYSLYALMSFQYLMFTMNSSGISPYRFFWQE